VFEEWVGEASVFGFEIFRSRQKGSALKNLAGALHTDGGGCTLSAGQSHRRTGPATEHFRRAKEKKYA
jgi:hypothetical protein